MLKALLKAKRVFTISSDGSHWSSMSDAKSSFIMSFSICVNSIKSSSVKSVISDNLVV